MPPLDVDPAPLLHCRGVQRRFPGGRVGLAHLDLDVHAGEVLCLLGPSGCGKSTALRLLGGLDEPTAGTIQRAAEADPARGAQTPGFVFQDAALLPWASVRDNVALPLRLHGQPASDRARRVDAALAQVGLADAADAVPRELSGGMRMRVSLARALVGEPRLWLLDEPFGALDEITRFALNQLLLDLCRARDDRPRATAVFVTHSVYEAVFLASRIVVMARPGRITETLDIDGPPLDTRDGAFRATPAFAEACVRVSEALRRASDASRTAAGAPA